MARCTGAVSTVTTVLCVLPGIQMSLNLKSRLALDSTSAFPSHPVSKTTDGNYGPFSTLGCMASYGFTMVWWRGILPSMARIQRIDIVFRIQDRADGYALWISNSPVVPSGIKCYEDVEAGLPNLIQNITSCNVTGTTVIIQITRSPTRQEYMDICEVDIYGCFTHTYGDQCKLNCTNCKHGCNPDDGVCDSTYCNAGWSGPRFCDQACSSVTFGENCVQECHCNTPGCNGVNGVCLTPGCEAGYHGTNCSQACLNTTFGENCSSVCHCDTPGCDPVTGHCTVPGCAAGWKGQSCNLPCSDGEFGRGCNMRCHCAVPGCNKGDGICTNANKECLDGWNGTSCSRECVTPYYGKNCTSQCRCSTIGCNHTDGICTAPGCQTGWMGKSCAIQCSNNMFGEDCLTTCHCKTPGCNRFNGTCLSSGGCNDGYVGSSCSTECTSGYFGDNCTRQCNCKVPGCSHVTGNCTVPGCMPGWREATCSERCPSSTHGMDCKFTCGQCVNLTVCHHETGACELGCMDGYYGKACDSDRPISDIKEATTSDVGGTIGGVIGTCVVAVIVIGTVIIFKRRHQAAKNTRLKYRENMNETGLDDHKPKETNQGSLQKKILRQDDGTISPWAEDEDEESMYQNYGADLSGVDNSSPISVQNFEDIVETKEADGLLDKEYQTLPLGAVHPHDVGKKEFNIPKNRFISTFPYDHSRVILVDQEPESDYINANYIDSISRPKAYIAVQGPKNKTVEAFWTMIWQQNCHTIAMLANLYENGKNKCYKYWPGMDEPVTSATFAIHLDTEKQYAFYVKRGMVLKHKHKRQERQIHQFHYTKWPDHDIPDVFELVMFHRHMQCSRIPGEGPLLVHCSAGIGRTGTLIALDALLEAGKTALLIDVLGYVQIMRKDRMNMVQTVNQYKAIHLALVDGLNFPNSRQTKTDFISFEDTSIYVVPVNQTQQNKEYQTLQHVNAISAKRLKYDDAESAENREKNRDMDILPGDNYRAALLSEIPMRNNYINAIKLPSFRNHAKYMVTQFPLRNTIVDFWTLVTDYRSSTLVCLEDSENLWWPEKSRVKYVAPFEIRSLSVDRCEDDIHASVLDIKNKQSGNTHRVKLFQVSNWAKDASTPSSQTALCKLHYLVEAWLMSQEEGPVVVTCLYVILLIKPKSHLLNNTVMEEIKDGAKRCGLYCLISTTLERLDMEADIDMYATTRQLQIRRPQFVATLDQYQYTWDAVKAYIQTTGSSDYQEEEAVYQNSA